jgi:chemotaxis protein MotA
MKVLLGYLIVIVSVFGGFIMSGGHMLALFQPYEFLIIVGAALGAFIISNSVKVIKGTGKACKSIFKGSSFSKTFNLQLLSLFFDLTNKIKKMACCQLNKMSNLTKKVLYSKNIL